jgi:hypothetical protein
MKVVLKKDRQRERERREEHTLRVFQNKIL